MGLRTKEVLGEELVLEDLISMNMLMLTTIVLLAAASRVCGAPQLPEANTLELSQWLANKQAAQHTVNCLTAFTPDDCDERAKGIGALLPSLIANNFECGAPAPACSKNSQDAITAIVGGLKTNYEDEYKTLIARAQSG